LDRSFVLKSELFSGSAATGGFFVEMTARNNDGSETSDRAEFSLTISHSFPLFYCSKFALKSEYFLGKRGNRRLFRRDDESKWRSKIMTDLETMALKTSDRAEFSLMVLLFTSAFLLRGILF